MSKRTILAALWSALLAWQPAGVNAQEFPIRNINFVVPFAAGTATDAVARWLGGKVSEELGRPVIIENISGANGMIGAREFLKRAPDGYNVFITTRTTHAANSNLYRSLPYYAAFAPQSATEAFTCSPERLARYVVEETEKWRRLVEIAGIETE
jgi:tripartite-type tricarboxylate transporter receptor subunit TctC